MMMMMMAYNEPVVIKQPLDDKNQTASWVLQL